MIGKLHLVARKFQAIMYWMLAGNVLFEDGKTIVINMKKFGYGLQLYDFYGYLRKIMEKNEWDEELAWEVMDTYSLQVNLTKEKIRVLWSFFVYPEKFWKIINYYFNSNKAESGKRTDDCSWTLGRCLSGTCVGSRILFWSNSGLFHTLVCNAHSAFSG